MSAAAFAIPPTVGLEGAAELMKVHPQTVADKIGRGELPAARLGSAYVLMTRDVLKHIEQQIAQQTAARLRRPLPKARRQVAAA